MQTFIGVDGELRDSSHLLLEPSVLDRRLNDDRYLLLRGVLDVDAVTAARREILELLGARGAVDTDTHDVMDAIEGPRARSLPKPTFDRGEVGRRFGVRWLSTDHRAGDLLIFTEFTMHTSLDNASPVGRIRLTSDTRYKLAGEPVAERFTR